MNIPTGTFKGNSKTPNSTCFFDLCRFLFSIWGVCPTRRDMFHETEANQANLCLVVDCFRGEIHQFREAGPPERPQREARWLLAQSRPPTPPRKKSEGRRKPSLSSLFSSQANEHQPGYDFAQEFDRCIPVAAARGGHWGGASPPKRSKSDKLLAGAGKTSLPLPRRSGQEARRRSPRWRSV